MRYFPIFAFLFFLFLSSMLVASIRQDFQNVKGARALSVDLDGCPKGLHAQTLIVRGSDDY